MNPEKTQQIMKKSIAYFNSFGIPNIRCKPVVSLEKILQKQKKRLGVKNPRITLEEVGFQEIKNDENLYNLTQKNKIKITNITSSGLKQVTIGLKASHSQNFSLQAGTLLFPQESISQKTQSLIIRDDISTTVSEGCSQIEVNTYCFNQELTSPGKDMFSLGNLKSNKFIKGMDQMQVWRITTQQRQTIKNLEELYEYQEKISQNASSCRVLERKKP